MKTFLRSYLRENIFHTKSYILEEEVFLDNKLIKEYLNLFWKEIMDKLDTDQKVYFLFRIRLGSAGSPSVFGFYATIGKLFDFSNSNLDFNSLYSQLKALLVGKGTSDLSRPVR